MTNHLYTPIALLRACAATVIPGGQKIALSAGEQVTITQALGGTFTVTTDSGYLARIAAKDADALGLERSDGGEVAASEAAGGEATGGEPVEPGEFDLAQVIDQLKTVFDPEIPVNVVDLGLVYGCEARPLVDGRQRVEIQMSMTAPGCGMGDVLAEDARVKVAALPGVAQVEIELVWDPPWDMSRMSDAARLQLGM